MIRSFRRVLALCFGAGLVLSAGCYPKNWNRTDPNLFEQQTHPFVAGPYLVSIAPRRMAVVIEHPLNEAPVVELWAAAEVKTSTTVLEANPRMAQASSSTSAPPPKVMRTIKAVQHDGLWVADLEELPLDDFFQYRVRSTAGVVGPFTFRVGISRGKPFRFAAFGDTRTGHEVHRLLIEGMAREQIEFVINSGDLVEFGGLEEQWQNYFRIEAPLISSSLLLPVVGNHDDNPRGLFQRYFLQDRYNSGRRYYVFDWGDVRFVALDSQIEMRRGSRQYAFAERALREGAEANQILVLSMHYPPYSSGEHGSSLETREVVADLAKRFGVELVLAGHDHDYERTKSMEGTVYIVAASAGATIRRLIPSDFTEVLRTEPHFILFDVERGGMLGRTINLQGDTFDTFTVVPNPARELLEKK